MDVENSISPTRLNARVNLLDIAHCLILGGNYLGEQVLDRLKFAIGKQIGVERMQLHFSGIHLDIVQAPLRS
jgi:hypothetical protein